MPGPVSVEFPRFGGLDLRNDPQEVQQVGTVDCLNVALEPDGRLRSRDGYSNFSTAFAASTLPLAMKAEYGVSSAPAMYLLTVHGIDLNFVYIGQNAGVTTSTFASEGGTGGWITAMGGSTNSWVVYSANGTTNLRGSKNATLTPVLLSAVYGGGPVGVLPTENRLIAANGSRVRFSAAGDPETFGANDFVDVAPGDGEQISDIVTWRELVFVFKQSKFFVFYSTSLAGDGTAIFNYRAVSTGQGIRWPGAVAATAEGVYFVNDSGVWLTTGGPPVKVSSEIDPLFQGYTLPYTSSTITNMFGYNVPQRLVATRGQLHLLTSVGTMTLYRNTGQWVASDMPAYLACGFDVNRSIAPVDGPEELFFTKSSGTKVYRVSSGTTTDDGVAISSRYRTGFWNPGQPGSESWVREWLLDGTGTVNFKTAVNDAATLGSAQSVTLGTSPAVAQGRDRRGVWGRNVSFEVSAASGAWSVSRVTPIVWAQRAPGLKSS